MATGHVFVTRGNITRLKVDAWVLPTDRDVRIEDSWFSAAFTRDRVTQAISAGALEDFRAEREFAVALPVEPGAPTPVLTAVPYEGSAGFEGLRARVLAGLGRAAEVAKAGGSRRPLIATPAFGVRGGGANLQRGEVIAGILAAAGEAAQSHEVDVVVCLQRDVDHALAQKARLAAWETAPPIPAAQLETVRRLADLIADGTLVPFMGSGVSASAGLPTWLELLDLLASDLPGRPDKKDWFKKLSALDQAHIVRGDRGKREFGEAVARHTTATRYGLAPMLLAALPTREAVTLNYDQLYEFASGDAGHTTAVLPIEPLSGSQRWLLKMHGCVTRPESIVLTRADYIDFRSDGATSASLAKAILMTKHLLFVGFGLADDHFHELVHEVGKTWTGQGAFGTALVLGDAPGHRAVWGDRITFESFTAPSLDEAARDLEIFLDVLGAHATGTDSFVLDERYDSQISDRERAAKQRFVEFMRGHMAELDGTVIGRSLVDLQRRLGGGDH